MLLALLGLIVVAGALFYTWSRREGDRQYAETLERRSVARSERADAATTEAVEPDSTDSQGYDELLLPGESGEEAPAEQAASTGRLRSAPEEVAAVEDPEPPAAEPAAPRGTNALATVRSFYGALSNGDGGSAAQFVVPAKRQSGPLSAGALSRYYSSFRRPLRVRRMTTTDANTVRVTYDYVLADGRLCQGEAAVDVVQSGDSELVSAIRTQGAC